MLRHSRGRILLAQSRDNRAAAEACYRQAIEVAKSQKARLLELRAATSLAGLWRENGKGDQARDLLTPSTAGSPRDSTPPISKRRRRCWTNCLESPFG